MPHRTFFWFILPSAAAMLLFIALPIVSVFVQSLHAEHEQVMKEVETCSVFTCETQVTVDAEATQLLYEEQPLGQFVGFSNYTNRAHLAFEEVGSLWGSSTSVGQFIAGLGNYPFYRALGFTLTYTFVVTPLVIALGFMIALAVNMLTPRIKGPVIFFSLLPMIITPLIGSLILFWMIDSQGILGATLQNLFDDPNLSLKAST
ncbi:MAG: sugar ABC transporter permease, partial [Pseudomonadota bacterium]